MKLAYLSWLLACECSAMAMFNKLYTHPTATLIEPLISQEEESDNTKMESRRLEYCLAFSQYSAVQS